MDVEPSPSEVAKKLWNVVQIVLFMVKKGMSKGKIMMDLQLILKRGKLAGKAIGNLMFHHQHHLSSLSCRSSEVSFISPREYEFSCSNSPAFYPFYTHKRRHQHHHQYFRGKSYRYDDVTTVAAVQRVFERLNNTETVEAASPMVVLPGFGRSPMLPGFGRSPMGRQLRVTDSPFPLKDDGDSQVDKAAEEFINKFYKDLRLQKRMAVLDSPAHRLGTMKW